MRTSNEPIFNSLVLFALEQFVNTINNTKQLYIVTSCIASIRSALHKRNLRIKKMLY
jgi:hypothetical protein